MLIEPNLGGNGEIDKTLLCCAGGLGSIPSVDKVASQIFRWFFPFQVSGVREEPDIVIGMLLNFKNASAAIYEAE